jgi:hypothetical protein
LACQLISNSVHLASSSLQLLLQAQNLPSVHPSYCQATKRCSNPQQPIKISDLQQQILPLHPNKNPQKKRVHKKEYKVWVLLKLSADFKMYPTRMFAGFTSRCTIPSLWRYCSAFAAKFPQKNTPIKSAKSCLIEAFDMVLELSWWGV